MRSQHQNCYGCLARASQAICGLKSGHKFNLTRICYVNNFLNFFRNVLGILHPQNLKERKSISRNSPEILSFCNSHNIRTITIHTEIITNENLEILFRFCFRNRKANKFPQILFRMCFRNGHVGHAQATTTGHTYESKSNPRDFLSLSLS